MGCRSGTCSLKTAQKKVKLTNLSCKRESELTSTLGLGKGEAKATLATKRKEIISDKLSLFRRRQMQGALRPTPEAY